MQCGPHGLFLPAPCVKTSAGESSDVALVGPGLCFMPEPWDSPTRGQLPGSDRCLWLTPFWLVKCYPLPWYPKPRADTGIPAQVHSWCRHLNPFTAGVHVP